MPKWKVQYRVILEGEIVVDARSAMAALELVEDMGTGELASEMTDSSTEIDNVDPYTEEG